MVFIGWFRTTCACKQVRSEKSVSRNVNRHVDGAVRNTLKSLFALAMRPEQHVVPSKANEVSWHILQLRLNSFVAIMQHVNDD